MKKLIIEKLIYGGFGLGRLEGKAVFVPFSAPGDEVEVEITTKHKGYDEAKIKKIITSSPDRLEPECQYFGVCGGCHLQHLSYAAQLLWKQLILEEQIIKIGGIKDPHILPTVGSPNVWNYRNRIQLHKNQHEEKSSSLQT